MSASPPSDEVDETRGGVDELDEGETEKHDAGSDQPQATPAKRPRGRPPGSKNKKTVDKEKAKAASSGGEAGASGDASPVKKKRGRPPKVHPLSVQDMLVPLLPGTQPKPEGEPPAKKKRGRPPKAKPADPDADVDAEGEGEGGEAPPSETPAKKKRGRPPKSATAAK